MKCNEEVAKPCECLRAPQWSYKLATKAVPSSRLPEHDESTENAQASQSSVVCTAAVAKGRTKYESEL